MTPIEAALASVETRRTIGLVAANTTGFVEAVFSAQSDGMITTPVRGANDQVRIRAAGVDRVVSPGGKTGWARLRAPVGRGPEVAQILFTSGTTGDPKGIAITHDNISDTTRRLNAAMEVDASIREYVGVPVHFSFGLGRCRAVSAAGGAFFLPSHGFDPAELASLLRSGEVNAISAVPTQLRLVLGDPGLVAPHAGAVRWIEIGSQAMTPSEKAALRDLFPNARIVQHYGLTEASRTTFLKIHEAASEALDTVGAPMHPTEVRLAAEGQVQIRGEHVAPFRVEGGHYSPLTDADGWLETNDLGEWRGENLRHLGRRDDVINCGGIKVSPEGLEAQIRAFLGGGIEIAVARTDDALRGEGILVAHRRANDPAAVRAAAVRAAEAFGLQASGAIRTMTVEDLPRTETGKIRRADLTALHAASALTAEAKPFGQPRPANAPLGAGETDALQARLLTIWREALGRDDVDVDQGFYDVGGDSLSAVGVALGMERAGLAPELAHGIFDGLTIAEIAAMAAPPGPSAPDIQERLLAIWRGALGRDDVDIHQGFYDVGGDSLSAVSVALGMEKAGFPPEVAHGIFDGKTVAQLAAELQRHEHPSPETAPAAKTEIAILGEASNFVKGIVFLCMIASHWLPIYLLAMHARFGLVGQALAPLFSLGSPTLAFAYGTGISLFQARQRDSNPKAFRKTVGISAALLAFGLLVGSGQEVIARELAGERPGAFTFAVELISGGPFFYYLLAALSVPTWIGRLKRTAASAFTVLTASAVAYALHMGFSAALPLAGAERAYSGLHDALVGHWGVFQMSSIVLLGVAFGQFIDLHISKGGKLKAFLPHGLLMMAGALLASAAAGDMTSWITFPKLITLWGALFYSGLAITILATFESFSARISSVPAARGAIAWICCAGVLLFPLYVAQSLVFHGSVVLGHYTGLSPVKALTAMILAFAVAVANPLWRVYKLYYAGRR